MMEHFLLHAHEEYLGDDADRIETYYCYNLQEFTPPKNKYDVVWMQWVACEYDSDDFIHRAGCRPKLQTSDLDSNPNWNSKRDPSIGPRSVTPE